MRNSLSLGAVIFGLLLGAASAPGATPGGHRPAPRVARGAELLTLHDVADSRAGEARFRAMRSRGAVTFERSAVVLEPFAESGDTPVRVRIDFPASLGSVALETDRPAEFAVGASGRDWRDRAAAFHEVRYRAIAPGADLIYHSESGQLVHSIVVAPGGAPSAVRLRYRGVRGLSLDSDGALELDTPGGLVREPPPVLYQESDGERRAVSGGYRIVGMNELTFWVGTYDASRTLIIDRVTP